MQVLFLFTHIYEMFWNVPGCVIDILLSGFTTTMFNFWFLTPNISMFIRYTWKSQQRAAKLHPASPLVLLCAVHYILTGQGVENEDVT